MPFGLVRALSMGRVGWRNWLELAIGTLGSGVVRTWGADALPPSTGEHAFDPLQVSSERAFVRTRCAWSEKRGSGRIHFLKKYEIRAEHC